MCLSAVSLRPTHNINHLMSCKYYNIRWASVGVLGALVLNWSPSQRVEVVLGQTPQTHSSGSGP